MIYPRYALSSLGLEYSYGNSKPQIREDLIKSYATGKTKDLKYRRDQLIHFAYLIKENRDRFVEALASDLHRPVLETYLWVQYPYNVRSSVHWRDANTVWSSMLWILRSQTVSRTWKDGPSQTLPHSHSIGSQWNLTPGRSQRALFWSLVHSTSLSGVSWVHV